MVDTMKRVLRDYRVRGFVFSDDNFFVDMQWAYRVFEEIVNADLDICIGKLHVRADTVCTMDYAFLNLIARAGVKRFVMGAESGNQRVLDLIKKRITVEQIVESNRKLIPHAISPAYLFMMGVPSETPAEVAMSIRLADQLTNENRKATRAFNTYTPYPGTELYTIAVQYGLKEPRCLEEWASLNYRYIHKESPWILLETKKLISVLDFALMCSAHDNSLGSFRKSDPIARWLAKICSPLSREAFRCASSH